PSTGGISEKSRAAGVSTRRDKRPPRRNGIVQCGRERVFGGQPIIGRDYATLCSVGKTPGDVTVERGRSRRVAAAMEEQNLAIARNPAVPDQRRRDASQARLGGLHPPRRWKNPAFIPAQFLAHGSSDAWPRGGRTAAQQWSNCQPNDLGCPTRFLGNH